MIRRYKFILISLFGYLLLSLFSPERLGASAELLVGFFTEMLQVLPPVFVLTAMISVWVPNEVITKHFGSSSSWKGIVLSFAVGSLSAGPIYAAFPAAAILLAKGARVQNVVIIISSWAVIKLPMLITEAAFLGTRFAVVRYLLTVPMICIIAYAMERSVKLPIKIEEDQAIAQILKDLPGKNCRACGYSSCHSFAQAVVQQEKAITDCRLL